MTKKTLRPSYFYHSRPSVRWRYRRMVDLPHPAPKSVILLHNPSFLIQNSLHLMEYSPLRYSVPNPAVALRFIYKSRLFNRKSRFFNRKSRFFNRKRTNNPALEHQVPRFSLSVPLFHYKINSSVLKQDPPFVMHN